MIGGLSVRLLSIYSLILMINISESNKVIPLCQPRLQYWSIDKLQCLTCSKCAPEFTIKLCTLDQDAICGPLSAFPFDWPFLNKPNSKIKLNKKQMITPASTANHQIDIDINSNMLWRFSESENHPEALNQLMDTLTRLEQDNNNINNNNNNKLVNSHSQMGNNQFPINSINELPWDWQSSALVLAVCACIIFFFVAGCSALIYVRQWRRMKRNFEPAGLEEISARLNLMVKAELAELNSGAPLSPGDPETRCQYLEKLLDRKRETPVVAGWPEIRGNLYIEEGETPKCKRAQIAQIHRNIESILNQKSTRE